MNHSARRVNFLANALGARNYLEIGVNDGQSFFDITVPERTGVDPDFRFDIEEKKAPNTWFVPKTSDAFFAGRQSMAPFDLIFIDGLHQFEQVVRDISNSILHSHAGSVILIDDTKPNDVYSSLPDMAATMRFRRAAGFDHPAWHGDVFKAVFYLHDFWPSLNYRTIVQGGNPQTLVWRSTTDALRSPRFNSLERISRLTYFELCDNLDILRESLEDDALNLCVEQVKEMAARTTR